MGKKLIFLLVMVLIVIILIGFFLINRKCNGLDEEKKQECKLCSESDDAVDCRDVIYGEVAFANQDLSLCDKIVQDFRKDTCLLRTESMISTSSKRGGSKSIFIPLENGGGYEQAS